MNKSRAMLFSAILLAVVFGGNGNGRHLSFPSWRPATRQSNLPSSPAIWSAFPMKIP